ncbi:MAG: redoxin domain-containing protein [Chloroflexi bacterium]|nr:redoxin domain-containing protein [Chloroflexota bacterium]
MPEVGQKAPDFTLPSTQGLLRLSDYVGKKVVLAFYIEDGTPG